MLNSAEGEEKKTLPQEAKTACWQRLWVCNLIQLFWLVQKVSRCELVQSSHRLTLGAWPKYRSSGEGTIMQGLRRPEIRAVNILTSLYLGNETPARFSRNTPTAASGILHHLHSYFEFQKPNRLNLLEFPLCTKVSHIMSTDSRIPLDSDDEMVKSCKWQTTFYKRGKTLTDLHRQAYPNANEHMKNAYRNMQINTTELYHYTVPE